MTNWADTETTPSNVDSASTSRTTAKGATQPQELPIMPPAGKSAQQGEVQALRTFHVNGGIQAPLVAPDQELLPALLWPFRHKGHLLRNDYPLLLDPQGGCRPLTDAIESVLKQLFPTPEQARTLKENVLRLERIVREHIANDGAPVSCKKILLQSADELRRQLALRDGAGQQLRKDLQTTISTFPDDARVLGLSAETEVWLLQHAAQIQATRRWGAFRDQLSPLVKRARALLQVEQTKTPEAQAPQAVGQTLGSAASALLDPAALSQVLGPLRGSSRLPADRQQRVQQALDTVQRHLKQPSAQMILLYQGSAAAAVPRKTDGHWHCEQATNPCVAAAARFDLESKRIAELVRAARTLQLELSDSYDANRHDTWLDNLSWDGFTRDELSLVPAIVALTDAEDLASDGLAALSRLLRSARPVQVLIRTQPLLSAGQPTGNSPLRGYHLELGYLGISHREVMVQQSSSARPQHLHRACCRALEATHPAMVVVSSAVASDRDASRPAIASWLCEGAALDGRAHPLFGYDPEAGSSWARRFEFNGNPDPQADWPVYELRHRATDGNEASLSLPFTFADFVLLAPEHRGHFCVVPAGKDVDDLIPVDDYLALPQDQAAYRIPFVWTVDGRQHLRRLAITRQLAFACRDRLGFWRTLQELAGVRSEHIDRAVTEAREAAHQEAAHERAELQAAHEEQLQRARRETASEVMKALAATLLQLDTANLQALRPAPGAVPSVPAASAAPQTQLAAAADSSAATQQATAEAAADEDDEEVSFDEPWIESALCTSCNDCTNLNALLFVYNENKQARIGDPKAGSYAELVQAAEKCPARCIHPGKPLNKDEPNLDELVKRAAPFN